MANKNARERSYFFPISQSKPPVAKKTSASAKAPTDVFYYSMKFY